MPMPLINLYNTLHKHAKMSIYIKSIYGMYIWHVYITLYTTIYKKYIIQYILKYIRHVYIYKIYGMYILFIYNKIYILNIYGMYIVEYIMACIYFLYIPL